MSDFVHLHVHSHYSLLDGLGKIRPLVERIKELGMDTVALTDHGVMYGMIDFIKTANDVGVKSIPGVEAYLALNGHTNKRGRTDSNPRHVTLLAKNITGYKNLMKLTTTAHLHGYYYKPRIDYDLLKDHNEGLIVLSGCLNGDIPRAIVEGREDDARRIIEWYLEIFGPDRFYLEVQHHPHIPMQAQANEGLIKYAKKYKVGLVATSDTHYIYSEDAQAHDVLLCVQTGKTVNDEKRMSMLDEDFSLKGPEVLKEAWKKYPEAIDNTVKIGEMCSVELEFGVNRLPRFPLPKGITSDGALREQCEAGLLHRYGDKMPEGAHARLDYELGVIKTTGYASYFLIVADFVNKAKEDGILVGPGRGSAAGSLVAYLMNITNLDPLKYNLLFERFLNPERVSMPDIDLDFADDRRDEVIEYVRQKYGNDRVAQIITFGTMAARAAVRDAGRALGFPYAFCDQVAKTVPLMSTFDEALVSGSELKALYDSDPQAHKLIDTARRLEGVCRHASTHAAGVVITDEPLTEYVPLQLSSSSGKDEKEDTVTQFPMKDVEALGLLKVDFLGLKNLTIIQNTLNRIEKRFGVVISLDKLPLGDEKSYRLLQEGKTTGVFQLESAGMKRYLKELKPTELEDIISMVALYRPGPMDSIPDFINAKHGRKKITYLHPILKRILERTYGIIVTQDQVLQIAREFSGFSYAEADILRKAVGKKIQALLNEQQEKFISGAINHSQVNKQTATLVWDFIEPFARYGFNRAHAACYAMIAYQTAYLKANYPAEFMAALLTSDEGNTDRAAIEVAESLAMGIEILPPDVNESDQKFTVVAGKKGDAIRFGLGAIKNVGHNAVAALIKERQKNGEFKNLLDIFTRIDPKDMNRKSLESLAKVGGMDKLAERQQIVINADRLLKFSRDLHSARDKGQQGLFGDSVETPAPKLTLDKTEPAAREERLIWEKELLGMYVSEHPMKEYQSLLENIVTPLAELSHIAAGQRVRVAGVVSKINKIITKSNKPMLFVELEDLAGAAEILVFPGTLEETSEFWVDGAGLIVEGKLSDKDGEAKVLTDKVWRLTKDIIQMFSAAPKVSRIVSEAPMPTQVDKAVSLALHIPTYFSRDKLTQLKSFLEENSDENGLVVEIIVPYNGSRAKLLTELRIKRSEDTMHELRRMLGMQSVHIR